MAHATVQPVRQRSDDELAKEAAAGDQEAAGELFARRWDLLTAMSRRIAGPTIDPEDLLAEAIASLLSLWRRGGGPRVHVTAFVIQSMRNRMTDEHRSPRSRVVALPDDESLVVADDEEHRRSDLSRELATVEAALGRLSEPYRRVLVATIVDGRRPRDLEEELGRPASAIYSLSRRARAALRRATAQVCLEEDAPPSCREAAGLLPEVVGPDPDATGEGSGMLHIRSCQRCRRAWSRFAAMGGSYSLLPLVVPVSLAWRTAEVDAAQSPGASSAVPPASPSAAGSAGGPAAAVGTGGQLLPVVGATLTAVRTTIAALSAPTRLAMVLAGTAAVTGAVVAGTSLAGAPAAPPQAHFDVSHARVDQVVALDVDFGVVDADWEVASLTFVVPAGAALADRPDSWTCDQVADEVTCTSTEPSDPGGTFTFDAPTSVTDGGYDVVLVATVGERTVTGTAGGPF
ncbi:RNA polymerase sigma factor (sigma-70 family) [Salana multivorans]|uniref:RNA polymerase sigma factor (Sigma-70 family) n=1 Tax=Salana multivorans TaxID=120377 RepID=A0A3N2D1N9_9MICO|nr:sigma-70 family RNA polymerase sigma factor [Salana multivorans]ROR93661.1 RNA polymerase sigma factor (sigma-70 family) [Salana multivorans]